MARFAILLAFVCCLTAVAQSSAPSPLARAVTLAREKRYTEASQTLQGVAEPATPPQRIAFHRLKAAIASGLNDPAAATAEMRQALALTPTDPGLLLATAVAERQSNHLDAAIEHATAAGANATALALITDIQLSRATDLIANQHYDDAIKILRATPTSAPVGTLLGIAQFARGDSDDAAATLSAAISLDPTSDATHRVLAQIVLQDSTAPNATITTQLCAWNATVCAALRLRTAREAGDPAQLAAATEILEKAPPTDPIASCELARAREWTSNLPAARTAMETCVAADPSPQHHYRLGLIYQRLGLTDLARKEMETRQQLLKGQSDAANTAGTLTKGMH